ncbi:glycosyltransferase [Arthrobacter sp. TMP15]|uniref:glycosyltransferase n=1 Tax=Arthrobacter sp. TMP15 TaxID=3140789 RepID=UPI0031BBBF7C
MSASKTPRVIIVSRLFAPEVGAAAYRLKALAEALSAAGADVEVFSTKPPKGTEVQASRYPVRRWPVLRDAGGNVRGYIQYMSFDIPVFFRLLFSVKSDVFVVEPPPTTGLMVSLVAALKRTPFVYFSADVSSSAAKGIGIGGPVLKVLTGLERYVLKRAKSILAVSEGVKQEVAALTGRIGNIVNVGTGVDTETFALQGDNKSSEGKYFVYAGTMSEIQGAGIFVDAFLSIMDLHPEVRLMMFGQGVELDALKAKVKDSNRQIVFNEPVAGAVVAQWSRSSLANLASVRPGKGYDFAFATKALAGLSTGAPSIYAGVGPLNEIITLNNLGIGCDWNVKQVAKAMVQAIENPVSGERRAELSKWVEQNHSLAAVAQTGAQAVIHAAHT